MTVSRCNFDKYLPSIFTALGTFDVTMTPLTICNLHSKTILCSTSGMRYTNCMIVVIAQRDCPKVRSNQCSQTRCSGSTADWCVFS